MSIQENRDTKDRILDTAERLFGERGFDATSLRAITSEAGVNLAAVHYHFGSKDSLIEAVFTRRLQPLNRQRLVELDELEAQGEPDLEDVVRAFVGPPLRLHQEVLRGGSDLMRLYGRTMAEPKRRFEQLFSEQFREVVERFTKALDRALPEHRAEEVFWGLHFAIGTMAHSMCDAGRITLISGGAIREPSVDETLDRLVRFIAAGMRGEGRS